MYTYLKSILGENFEARELYNYIYGTTGVCDVCGKRLDFYSLLNGYNECIDNNLHLYEKYKNASKEIIYEEYVKPLVFNNKRWCVLNKKLKDDYLLNKLYDLSNLNNVEELYRFFNESVNCECEICGKKTKFNGMFSDRPYNQFCSKKCRNEWWSRKQIDDNTSHRSDEETLSNARKKQSDTIKQKISDGEFTPNVTNSWCHSKIQVIFKNLNGELITRNVRSSWEAMFQLMNPSYEYETLRVEYINTKGEKCNYIVDFIDRVNKVVYEIKPKSNTSTAINTLKRNALLKWCDNNNYTYSEITEEYFIENEFRNSLMKLMDDEYYDKMMALISKYYEFNIINDYKR